MGKTEFNTDKENLTVDMSRVFDAPRELVWKAHTQPELIEKWWGRRQDTTSADKLDAKQGGDWQFTSTDEKGKAEVFYGEYLEMVEPEYITWTFNYKPMGEGHEATETVTFEELDGKTKVTSHSHFKNKEDFKGMNAESGMEEGATESWDRLEELLEELK